MSRRRYVIFLLGLCLPLVLAACGDDPKPTRHGLKAGAPESRPHGEPVATGFGVSDGDLFLATVSYGTRLWQRAQTDAAPDVRQDSATMIFELEQRFALPGGGRPPSSKLRLRYTETDDEIAKPLLERDPLEATVEHEPSGRVVTTSLRLVGGTKAEQAEALGLLGGLPLAGFGGSPSWLPDRPVRAGEVWRMEGFIRPRGMDAAIQQAKQLGLQTPEPTLSGTIRVLAVREGLDGKEIELEIDSLIELEGPIRQGDERGQMSFGHQVVGRAVLSARTGLPISFEVTETKRNNIRSGAHKVERRITNTYSGTVRRKD